tara:strand:- start:3033 stop:3809 length:777 start_codon:yes stop_codon:yes gene_type:complete
MAINKSLNIGVKRAHKQGDWVGFDAVEVIQKGTIKQSLEDSDAGRIAKAIIETTNNLLTKDGAKINESIDNDTLNDQIIKLIVWRDNETAKEKTTRSKPNMTNRDKQLANEQSIMGAALTNIITAMQQELKLRDMVESQIASAQTIDTLDEWTKIKNAWRSTDQKKKIADNIRRVEAAIKSSEEAAKLEAAKQAKLDELNKKLATSTDPAEKQAIASQISALMGNVSTQTGLPKGALYIGIGVAVVVGIWITLRAIRK